MSAPHFKYILVGGGLAASSAAQAIRAIDTEGNLLLLGQEVNRPYHRPPLSKEYLQGKRSQKEIFTLPDQWFIQHQDRVLFGKDIWEPTEYYYYFRVLETADEYFDYYRKRHAFWKMYGLDLPDEVLKKLYYKNALRVIPGLSAAGFPQ